MKASHRAATNQSILEACPRGSGSYHSMSLHPHTLPLVPSFPSFSPEVPSLSSFFPSLVRSITEGSGGGARLAYLVAKVNTNVYVPLCLRSERSNKGQ